MMWKYLITSGIRPATRREVGLIPSYLFVLYGCDKYHA